MIPVAVVGDRVEDMWRLAGVSRLRLVYCTINMDVFSVHRSTCKQTGASERSRVRAEIVYITVSELFLVGGKAARLAEQPFHKKLEYLKL